MAKYVETLSTHGDDKKAASAAMVEMARFLTRQGRGKTHYVKVVTRKGDYHVELYERKLLIEIFVPGPIGGARS